MKEALKSQSAFAGYGLEAHEKRLSMANLGVAIRFRWIWVGDGMELGDFLKARCRNPLSLDMGWKMVLRQPKGANQLSQSAFAGYGLEAIIK